MFVLRHLRISRKIVVPSKIMEYNKEVAVLKNIDTTIMLSLPKNIIIKNLTHNIANTTIKHITLLLSVSRMIPKSLDMTHR